MAYRADHKPEVVHNPEVDPEVVHNPEVDPEVDHMAAVVVEQILEIYILT